MLQRIIINFKINVFSLLSQHEIELRIFIHFMLNKKNKLNNNKLIILKNGYRKF